MTRRRVTAVAGALALCAGVLTGAGCSSGGDPIGKPPVTTRATPPVTPAPNRSVIAYGGQFLSSCAFSHTRPDDPIMHRGHPGASHQHEFFGNASTDADSTGRTMLAAASTCSDIGDRSGYWVPALFVDGHRVTPRRVDAYYRTGPGVAADTVMPYPAGLEILAGDQHSTRPGDLLVAAWACGLSPTLSHVPPRDCTPDRPVQLRLTYPSCWDGHHLASADHTSHMSYPSRRSGCDAAHPVPVPQLTLTVHYDLSGDYRSASLASGDFATTHGDFLAAWQPRRIADQVAGCLRRQVTCGIVGGTFHTGQGSRDTNTYNLPPARSAKGGYAGHAPDGGAASSVPSTMGDMASTGHDDP